MTAPNTPAPWPSGYSPPSELYILEEVEMGGGYHTLHVVPKCPERDWSEPYKKSSNFEYRNRVVRVTYPPTSASASGSSAKSTVALDDAATNFHIAYKKLLAIAHVTTEDLPRLESAREVFDFALRRYNEWLRRNR